MKIIFTAIPLLLLSFQGLATTDEVDSQEEELLLRNSIPLVIVVPEGAALGALSSKKDPGYGYVSRESVLTEDAALYLDPVNNKGSLKLPWGVCRFDYLPYQANDGSIDIKCPAPVGHGGGSYVENENSGTVLSIKTSKGFLITSNF